MSKQRCRCICVHVQVGDFPGRRIVSFRLRGRNIVSSRAPYCANISNAQPTVRHNNAGGTLCSVSTARIAMTRFVRITAERTYTGIIIIDAIQRRYRYRIIKVLRVRVLDVVRESRFARNTTVDCGLAAAKNRAIKPSETKFKNGDRPTLMTLVHKRVQLHNKRIHCGPRDFEFDFAIASQIRTRRDSFSP